MTDFWENAVLPTPGGSQANKWYQSIQMISEYKAVTILPLNFKQSQYPLLLMLKGKHFSREAKTIYGHVWIAVQ